MRVPPGPKGRMEVLVRTEASERTTVAAVDSAGQEARASVVLAAELAEAEATTKEAEPRAVVAETMVEAVEVEEAAARTAMTAEPEETQVLA